LKPEDFEEEEEEEEEEEDNFNGNDFNGLGDAFVRFVRDRNPKKTVIVATLMNRRRSAAAADSTSDDDSTNTNTNTTTTTTTTMLHKLLEYLDFADSSSSDVRRRRLRAGVVQHYPIDGDGEWFNHHHNHHVEEEDSDFDDVGAHVHLTVYTPTF
jgi:hypothetical protein